MSGYVHRVHLRKLSRKPVRRIEREIKANPLGGQIAPWRCVGDQQRQAGAQGFSNDVTEVLAFGRKEKNVIS